MKKLILLLVVLFGVNQLFAQQLTLKNGEVFTLEIRNISKAEFTSDEQYTFQYKVISSNSAEYKLQCILLKAKSQLNISNKLIQLNSDSVRQTALNYAGLLTPIILLQRPFTVVLSPKSKLIRFEGVDELVQQAISRWHIIPGVQVNIKPNLNALLSAVIKNMFFELPDERISYQSAWTNAEKMSYNVIAIRGPFLDITAVNADKTIRATYVLNEVTGLLADANVSGKYYTGKILQQNHYTQTMSANIIGVADTAWLNMAICMSNMSDMFKTKTGDIDPAVALSYFKTHDDLYKNDAYYLAKKRALTQRIK